MISVIVERAPGDKQGDPISNPLITADNVAIEHGRNEIDSNFSSRETVSSNGPYLQNMRQGRILEVADSEQLTWRGIIRTCSINITAGKNTFERIISLTVEREA